MAFKSRFILSYFVYPNTHLPGFASQTLPDKQLRVCCRFFFWTASSRLYFVAFLFSCLHKTANTLNTFSPLDIAKITRKCGDKIFWGKTDTMIHESHAKTKNKTSFFEVVGNIFISCLFRLSLLSDWFSINGSIYLQISCFFCSKSYLFLSQWEWDSRTK